MNMVWIVLSSMAAGAIISEMYHARMWKLYRIGKNEGKTQRNDVNRARSLEIHR